MNRFNNTMEFDFHGILRWVVGAGARAGWGWDWPVEAQRAIEGLGTWWRGNRFAVGGPADLLGKIEKLARADADWFDPEYLRQSIYPGSWAELLPNGERFEDLPEWVRFTADSWPPLAEDVQIILNRFQELEIVPPGHLPRPKREPQDAAGSDHKPGHAQPTTRSVKKGGKTNLVEAVVRAHLDKHGIEGATQAIDAAWIVAQVKLAHGVDVTDRLARKWLASAGRKLILEKAGGKKGENEGIDLAKSSHVAGMMAMRVKSRPN
jgi:hypothetical protein